MTNLEILKKLHREQACNILKNRACNFKCNFFIGDGFHDCALCRDAEKKNMNVFEYIKEFLKFELLEKYL